MKRSQGYPLSQRNVHHETVRLRRRRFGPMFANDTRGKPVEGMGQLNRPPWLNGAPS